MMAPASRSSSATLRSNGHQDGGSGVFDVPPSTMAAQLINGISTAKQPAQPAEQSYLQSIMTEVSSMENSSVKPDDPAVLLAHKHKLIYVLARALLEKLGGEDPFLDIQQAVLQASEALDVFAATIKEFPEVLDYVLPDGITLQARGPVPLWVWLFPRVLTLLGQASCEILTSRVEKLFSTVFRAVSQSPKLWNMGSVFFIYLKDCVTTVLDFVQYNIRRSETQSTGVTLPSANNGWALLSLEGRDISTSPMDQCTYTLRGISRIISHGQHLLSVLLRVSTETVLLHKATPAFQDYVGWMLDTVISLDELEKRRLSVSLTRNQQARIGWGFCSVKTLLSSLQDSLSPTVLQKGYISLAILCADLLSNPEKLSDPSIQFILSSGILNLASICRQFDSIRQRVTKYLMPILQDILGNNNTKTLIANDLFRAGFVLSQACGENLIDVDLSIQKSRFDSQELIADFRRLELLHTIKEVMDFTEVEDTSRPSKRRKVSAGCDILDGATTELSQILMLHDPSSVEVLTQITEDSFSALSDRDRCNVMNLLGQLPCCIKGFLNVNRKLGKTTAAKCPLCEGIAVPDLGQRDKAQLVSIKKEAILALGRIIKSVDLHDNRRPRVLAMFTLRKFALHFDEAEFLNLEVSSYAQWCLKSLSSSNRELRIAAGRTLPAFLRSSPVATKNRINVIGLLRSVPETDNPHLQETYILAWGQVGRILNDDELNLVLLRLVEYLGNSNSVISGAAFNEVLRLAEVAGVNVERFLSPFWESIAFAAVKNLLVRPQSTQMLSDLLGISVAEFLVLTQSYTVPLLILSKQSDVIKRISEARKDKQDFLVVLENSNLVPTLVLLLQQSTPDMERFIMSHLERVTSKFQEQHMDLSTLMKQAEPSSQARLLLQAAGEADDSKKSRIRLALQFLAERTGVPGANAGSGSKIIGPFLEHHILGIVARLTDVVNDPRNEGSIAEKRRAVKTVDELVKVAKAYARVARPQICSCLQLAFTQKALQECAFSAWNTILITLEDEDVEAMLESTFSTIIQHWNNFSEIVQKRAILTLQFLLDNRKSTVRNAIVNLPSLSTISQLSDIDRQLKKLRAQTDVRGAFENFARRLAHENSGVVAQSLIELKVFLKANQSFLQASAVSEQPDNVVGQVVRSILDNCVKFSESDEVITQLCAECIGLVGCLDSNRVESVREYREMVVVSNFDDILETTDFVLCILEKVIVPVFLSTTDTGIQGFFSFVIQELLFKFNFREACMNQPGYEEIHKKWQSLPPALQDTLTPFLNSKFMLQEMNMPETQYPLFRPDQVGSRGIYINWVKSFVLDLLRKHSNLATQLMFPILCRTIRIRTISPANFLLPYVVLHAIVTGTDQHRVEIGSEILRVLQYEVPADSPIRREDLKLCVEAAFHILEYLARWIQEKQIQASQIRGQKPADDNIDRVNLVLRMIPPEIISRRAVECKSYARALFYWEQHIRNVRQNDQKKTTNTVLLQRLQDIYTQIDEPDGIEGFSAKLHILDIDQQVLGHRKAGRWTAAQSWYEIQLAEKPGDVDLQLNLLSCLKESGQHDVLLNYVEGIHTPSQTISKLLPFAAEASWATGRWAALEKYTKMVPEGGATDFNVGIGRSLLALQTQNSDQFKASIHSLREQIARSLSSATTSSLSACHENMLRLHVLTELEMIAGMDDGPAVEHVAILESLNRRLEVVGSYLNDKQYLLGIRRAAMQLSSLDFTKGDIASAWLTSARLARKGNAIHQSFNAVLHASQLGDDSATIEHARLLWQEGNHRKAIQALRGAIDTNAFVAHNRNLRADTSHTGVHPTAQQNLLKARAHLLLAKWLDKAGQTPSSALRKQYQEAAKMNLSSEKGHYYLGRHYNKLLESEKSLAAELQNEAYLTGETAKLVIENYLRSLMQGTKYIYQTLPRILTLWLDLGTQVNQPLDPRYGNSKDFVVRIMGLRKTHLDAIHQRLSKYVTKMPAYMFYTALPQIVSRINHSNQEVFKWLQNMIYKVVIAHPQQALWSLLAVCTSTQQERRSRGGSILNLLMKKKSAAELPHDIKAMIKNGEKLTEQLLLACNAGEFHGNRTIWASLTKDLGFVQKNCLPSLLAVPAESVLTATLPTLTDNVREHKAFSRDVVTITSFLDEVLVLSSLQKPRKLTARGSDGRKYGLMCKPKDDLRKDQRLMEFNSMINRSLKRDAESSRRQLYIKTYAVTPLNEECGIIEWVDGLKTLRDILLALYKAMGVSPNYNEIAMYCDKALENPEETMPFFTEKVLGQFPPIFHKWFVQQFPEPSTWFAARLRYTRSCAVMSMVGTILGLGDRHGENILFEEGNGGTFHVDFNCLFDKGLTFAKAERVPFRLTHNMIDAMGMYGYEGPFRKSSELTLRLLRQHEETLMTILEAFVYDPTLDLLAKKPDKKRKEGGSVPQTAQGVLDTIQRKVKGLLTGESVPLSVEGQVDTLIDQATNPAFLAGMYIGWCSFL